MPRIILRDETIAGAVAFFQQASNDMRLLYFLAQVFINTFGITQPSQKQRRTVALLLGGFLLTVFLLVLSVTTFLLYNLHSAR